MKIYLETERLLLREILPSDKEGMFELEGDAEVQRYLGNRPVKDLEQTEKVIAFIRQQYLDNGIGRWAVIEKTSGAFLGWGGFKLMTSLTNNHINYYDLGYRLIRKHWGKGYATELASACLVYGFENLGADMIYAMADAGNLTSRSVLEKSGFHFKGKFSYEDVEHDWFEMARPDGTDK